MTTLLLLLLLLLRVDLPELESSICVCRYAMKVKVTVDGIPMKVDVVISARNSATTDLSTARVYRAGNFTNNQVRTVFHAY